MEVRQVVWRKCSSCKKDIGLGQVYWVCSISTCRGNATNYVFCSVSCWDAHVPTERHRPDSAGAIEKRAPQTADAAAEPEPAKRRVLVSSPANTNAAATAESGEEVLVVVSKVRKYIQDSAGMNTSAGVYEVLTERIKRACDLAVQEARAQGRKTVMDRDFHG